MKVINSSTTNTIEVVKRSEALSKTSLSSLAGNYRGTITTGAQFDDAGPGAGNAGQAKYDGKLVKKGDSGTHAIIVMDSKSMLSYSDGISRPALPGETLAHELLGHGLGGQMTGDEGSVEAIQAGNMYLRSQGLNYFRPDHGSGTVNDNFSPNVIPAYLDDNPGNFDDSGN